MIQDSLVLLIFAEKSIYSTLATRSSYTCRISGLSVVFN